MHRKKSSRSAAFRPNWLRLLQCIYQTIFFLNAIAARGYMCVPESARAIIRERLASGLRPRPPLVQFGHEMLQRDIARYRETQAADHPVFFDRGIVDALGVLAAIPHVLVDFHEY